MEPHEILLFLIKFTLCIGFAALIIGIGHRILLGVHIKQMKDRNGG